jgi:FkbH-like protein
MNDAKTKESAYQRIRSLRGEAPPAAEYMALARALKDDPEARERLQPVRLVLLSSFTTTLLEPYVKVEAARHGLYADIHHGGWGQFEQALLGDEWRAPDGAPEALVVMMRVEDLHPDVAFRSHDGADALGAIGADVLARIDTTLSMFRDKSKGPALVANFAVPEDRHGSVFDANQPSSLVYQFHALNRALLDRVAKRASSHVWDYAGLVASAGSAKWTDPRLWQLSRTPIAAANQPAFARHLARTLRGAMKPASKCLVLDLDNTIWGGVIGDDGIGGIQLGQEHPGRAFKEFQRACLGLRDRGILLAISSKNDEAVVHDAFERHPEMILKLKDFAATRINWKPKSQNLREIAKELNIGLDSLVFFDDNPVERAEVAESAPEVHVVDVPADPAHYVRALCELHVFDMPRLTAEDRMRAASYAAEAERKKLEAAIEAGTVGADFLPTLNMEVEIGPWNTVTAQRIAQLVIKTNQFNTTTRRLSEAELARIHEEDLGVYWLRLADKYGDMGLIAVGILTAEGKDAVVHGFILSCRAANRGMEQTMIAYLAKKAKERGFERLIGEFIPSAKNTPVVEMYPKLGFEKLSEADGVTRYVKDLSNDDLTFPDYIKLREAT